MRQRNCSVGPAICVRKRGRSARRTRVQGCLGKRLVKIEEELIALLQPVKLNNASIEVLVEEHYKHSKQLVNLESQLLRMATKAKVKRESFMERYLGSELDPKRLQRVGRLQDRGGSLCPKEPR